MNQKRGNGPVPCFAGGTFKKAFVRRDTESTAVETGGFQTGAALRCTL